MVVQSRLSFRSAAEDLPPPPALPADVVAMVLDAGCQWVLGPEHWPGNEDGHSNSVGKDNFKITQ